MNALELMRFRRGLSIGEVAQGARLSRVTVRAAELTDPQKLTAPTVEKLAVYYEVSVEVVLGFAPDPEANEPAGEAA